VEKGMKVSAGNRRRVQVRKPRKGDFTGQKKQVFLDHLAGCCNVTRSAAAAGVSVETVNSHRRRDPAFQQQCDEALGIGYDYLDSAMLEEAARGGHYEGAADRAGRLPAQAGEREGAERGDPGPARRAGAAAREEEGPPSAACPRQPLRTGSDRLRADGLGGSFDSGPIPTQDERREA
jgi:hypothetical protein